PLQRCELKPIPQGWGGACGMDLNRCRSPAARSLSVADHFSNAVQRGAVCCPPDNSRRARNRDQVRAPAAPEGRQGALGLSKMPGWASSLLRQAVSFVQERFTSFLPPTAYAA